MIGDVGGYIIDISYLTRNSEHDDAVLNTQSTAHLVLKWNAVLQQS